MVLLRAVQALNSILIPADSKKVSSKSQENYDIDKTVASSTYLPSLLFSRLICSRYLAMIQLPMDKASSSGNDRASFRISVSFARLPMTSAYLVLGAITHGLNNVSVHYQLRVATLAGGTSCPAERRNLPMDLAPVPPNEIGNHLVATRELGNFLLQYNIGL